MRIDDTETGIGTAALAPGSFETASDYVEMAVGVVEMGSDGAETSSGGIEMELAIYGTGSRGRCMNFIISAGEESLESVLSGKWLIDSGNEELCF
jgi:hypothetical protein